MEREMRNNGKEEAPAEEADIYAGRSCAGDMLPGVCLCME